MIKKLLTLLVGVSVIFPLSSNASILGIATTKDLDRFQVQIDLIRYQIEDIQKQLEYLKSGGDTSQLLLGGDTTLPLAGTVYTLSGSGVSGSATSIGLTSLTIPQTSYEIQDAELSDTFYLTLEPGSRTRQEIVSCTTVSQSGTDNTATLSGCTRGLLPFTPYTASSTYQFAHGGGTSAVFSNPPQLYNEFTGKTNDETISGAWTFTAIPLIQGTPSATSSATNKSYVDAQVSAGAADATTDTEGIVMFATQTQTANGTATSSASSTFGMAPQNRFFNTTSSATTTVPVTQTDGKLSQGFLDLTEEFVFTGGVSSTGALAVSGVTTISTTTVATSTTLTVNATSTFNKSVTFNVTTTGIGIPAQIGWIKLGETILGATNATATVSISGTHKNYMIYAYASTTNAINNVRFIVFNNDNATNYSLRYSENGAADNSNTLRTGINVGGVLTNTSSSMITAFIQDPPGSYKSFNGQATILTSVTDTTPPNRVEMLGTYATTTRISSISLTTGAGTFDTGSYITVYGSDY